MRNDLKNISKKIKKETLKIVYAAKASHIGGALSMIDILTVLYFEILKVDPENPEWEDRDIFLLSKGHACSSLYVTLANKGFFSFDELKNYGKNGSIYLSHTSHYVPGVELSTGSLGHALPVSCGIALAKKGEQRENKVFVLLSDGELDEGSNWEAFLFAPKHNLDNLCVIVDYNKMQGLGNTEDIINLEPLGDKLRAFNWETIEVNGHNHIEIFNAITLAAKNDKPTIIIAHTIKGNGVDYMENSLKWHYKSPNEEEFKSALKQIEEQ